MRCRDALRIGIPGVEKSTPYEKEIDEWAAATYHASKPRGGRIPNARR